MPHYYSTGSHRCVGLMPPVVDSIEPTNAIIYGCSDDA